MLNRKLQISKPQKSRNACIELGMTAKSFHDNTLQTHLKRSKFLGYTQGDVQIPREGIHNSLQFKGKFNFVHLKIVKEWANLKQYIL